MQFDPTVVAAFIGLGGLVVAAILSSAGYFYRSRLEGKKSARQVLYLLLEMRYTLYATTFDPPEAAARYINHYVERLSARGIRLTSEDLGPALQGIAANHFANVAEAATAGVKERLLQPFEHALSGLAAVSPVLAYRLRGKEKLEAFATLTTEYTEKMQAAMLSDLKEDSLRAAMTKYMQDTKRRTIDELRRRLDEDILLLAKHCGRRDLHGSREVIAKKFGEISYEDSIELDRLIDRLIEQVAVMQKPATAEAMV